MREHNVRYWWRPKKIKPGDILIRDGKRYKVLYINEKGMPVTTEHSELKKDGEEFEKYFKKMIKFLKEESESDNRNRITISEEWETKEFQSGIEIEKFVVARKITFTINLKKWIRL